MGERPVTQAPFERCPQFESCSAPRCPLDPDADGRDALPGEPKCLARRSTRLAIAADYPELLPLRGLTHHELVRESRSIAAKSRWQNMSEESRAKRLANLRPAFAPNKSD